MVARPFGRFGYQKILDNAWSGNAQTAKIAYDGKYGAGMLYAEWPPPRRIPWSSSTAALPRATTPWIFPRGGIGREALARAARLLHRSDRAHAHRRHREEDAQEVTRGAKSDYDKAKAIYEWIVDNTYRDPQTRGCGVGDIKTMLETGNLGASAPT